MHSASKTDLPGVREKRKQISEKSDLKLYHFLECDILTTVE